LIDSLIFTCASLCSRISQVGMPHPNSEGHTSTMLTVISQLCAEIHCCGVF